LVKDFFKGKFKISELNQIYEFLYKIFIVEKTYDKRIYHFRKFIKENITLSIPCYEKKDIENVINKHTYLICGSDQIWNPIWFDPIYFLDFGSESQIRIAYAPSGIAIEDSDSNEIYLKMAKYINKIDNVSVRESQSVDILKKYTQKNIETVLDPTLLVESKDWDLVASKRLIEEPYIFCYIMGNLRPYKIVLKKLMDKYHVEKVVYIPSNVVESQLQFACPFTTAGPGEFISLIKNAQAICTDSFHGTVLSIKYKKQFYNFKRVQKDCERWANSSRIDSILNKIEISERTLKSVKDVINMKDINYNKTQIYINNEITKSMQYLTNSFSKIY